MNIAYRTLSFSFSRSCLSDFSFWSDFKGASALRRLNKNAKGTPKTTAIYAQPQF